MNKKIEQLKSDLHSKIKLKNETFFQMLQEAVTAYYSENENKDELISEQQKRLHGSIQ